LDIRSNLGKELTVGDLKKITINQGDSFVLVFKMKAPESTFVKFQLNNGSIKLSNFNESFVRSGVSYFEFEIQYMLSSFFDNILELKEQTQPTYLIGDGSVTDNFRIQFYPEWNNPNVYIENDLFKN